MNEKDQIVAISPGFGELSVGDLMGVSVLNRSIPVVERETVDVDLENQAQRLLPAFG
jgi:hypothetical protein